MLTGSETEQHFRAVLARSVYTALRGSEIESRAQDVTVEPNTHLLEIRGKTCLASALCPAVSCPSPGAGGGALTPERRSGGGCSTAALTGARPDPPGPRRPPLTQATSSDTTNQHGTPLNNTGHTHYGPTRNTHTTDQ